MPLDPRAEAFLDSLATLGGLSDPRTVSIERQRKWMEVFVKAQVGKAQTVSSVEDPTIPGPDGEVPIRAYTPEGRGTLPVLVYSHGGAFTMGSIDAEDAVCRRLANGAEAAIGGTLRLDFSLLERVLPV